MVAKNRRSRPRAFVTDLFFAACISLGALCALEAGLRYCGPRLEASLYQIDSVRNFSFRPNAAGWHTDENDVFVRMNKFGNRDRERSLDAKPHTLRIAVLGSSTTAGLEVEQQQTYTAVLERELSRPGASVEVLNFGVSCYATAQDFYTLRDQVWQFHPQIIIEEVQIKLHIVNATRRFPSCFAGPSHEPAAYPYFRLAGNSVVPDEASERFPKPTPQEIASVNRMRNLANVSALLRLAKATRDKFDLRSYTQDTIRGAPSQPQEIRTDRLCRLPPRYPEVEQGWEIFERLLVKMREESNARGAEFWVIESNDGFQVDPDPAVAETVRREMRAPNLEYGDLRFEHMLEDHQIHHIYLRPSLMAYVNRTKARLHGGPKMMPPWEGHWNALGHRVVAETVAAKLRGESIRFQQWEKERIPPVHMSSKTPERPAATN